MKQIILLLALGLLLLGCTQQGGTGGYGTGTQGGTGTPSGTPSGTGATSTVHISGYAFQPADLTVKQGTTVTWVNDDSVPHHLKMNGVFESSTLSNGQSYTHTFTEAPGSYPYSCTIHPSMQGTVTVTG
ncbi:MAG: cupredoxin domain-containing protein [Candidatus ainarchaeum sp.]|nr:cupredoxin domain-containing protein [Candidatus ainarchaeum sp.]